MPDESVWSPRRAKWAHTQVEIGPEGEPQKPRPERKVPESKKPFFEPDPVLPDFLQEKGPEAQGFMRVVHYVKQKRKEGIDEWDLHKAAAKFVATYPKVMEGLDKAYVKGMKAALKAYQKPTEA
jgi:hypothetical protein